MTSRAHCARCNGSEFAAARLAAPTEVQLTSDPGHVSGVAARVCLTCGHVELAATDTAALRRTARAERDVQEYDF
jgi:hypothetical protein